MWLAGRGGDGVTEGDQRRRMGKFSNDFKNLCTFDGN